MLSSTAIALLRESIEESIGRTLRTPKDFDFLAESIFEKLHQRISPTTLKRLWGYLHDTSSSPRPSTLDLLAQFIDYNLKKYRNTLNFSQILSILSYVQLVIDN